MLSCIATILLLIFWAKWTLLTLEHAYNYMYVG